MAAQAAAGTDIGAARSDRVALAAFLGVSVLASGNGIAIRVGLRELEPLWSAALRFALASAALVLIMTVMRLPWPRGRQLSGAVAFGAIGLGASFALANYALQTAQAGLGQTVLALVPLVTLILAVLVRQERLTFPAMAGALVAAAGVVLISSRGAPAPVPTLTLLAILGSVLAFASAAVVVRRSPPVHPVAMNAVAVLVATAVLLTGAALAGESMVLPRIGQTWFALGYLAVVGSVAVFSLQLLVLKHWSASRANYVFVVIPVFTIPLSAWLDDESVGPGLLLGAVLVVAGVYLGALRGRWRSTVASAPQGPEEHTSG